MKRADYKEFVEENEGKDKIVGRPIELNKVELDLLPKTNYAELCFFGDLHLGHPQCDIFRAKEMLKWALKNQVYLLLMGDILEAGLRDSIGDSVYRQKLNPQRQMEFALKLLEPVKHLIIGMHLGNHEQRILKTTSIDIVKIMAKELGVRYLGYSAWSLVKVGSQKYSIYSTHGKSGARFKHTKLKSIVDLTGWLSADILAEGHVHSIAAEPIMRQYVDNRTERIVEAKCYAVLTGSYLKWNHSYAEDAGYPISRIGSPKAKLIANEHDIHFRI